MEYKFYPCKSALQIVGDGFIRPEITSLCVNGRYLPRIDERAYLGTDKSVPYKKPATPPTTNAIFKPAFIVCCATLPLCLCASV
ncbi:MAG: hypothetical protein FWG87_14435 [Defluviitaleaceae bacterium]|nr:hypothetical protein [Defluviitaleaceae bacterium]